MESSDPHGSLGALGVGDGERRDGELDGDGAGWPSARPVIAANPTRMRRLQGAGAKHNGRHYSVKRETRAAVTRMIRPDILSDHPIGG